MIAAHICSENKKLIIENKKFLEEATRRGYEALLGVWRNNVLHSTGVDPNLIKVPSVYYCNYPQLHLIRFQS